MAATGQCQGPRARPATPESELAVQIGPGFESGLAAGRRQWGDGVRSGAADHGAGGAGVGLLRRRRGAVRADARLPETTLAQAWLSASLRPGPRYSRQLRGRPARARTSSRRRDS